MGLKPEVTGAVGIDHRLGDPGGTKPEDLKKELERSIEIPDSDAEVVEAGNSHAAVRCPRVHSAQPTPHHPPLQSGLGPADWSGAGGRVHPDGPARASSRRGGGTRRGTSGDLSCVRRGASLWVLRSSTPRPIRVEGSASRRPRDAPVERGRWSGVWTSSARPNEPWGECTLCRCLVRGDGPDTGTAVMYPATSRGTSPSRP